MYVQLKIEFSNQKIQYTKMKSIESLLNAIYRCALVDDKIPAVLSALGYSKAKALLAVKDVESFLCLTGIACRAIGLKGDEAVIAHLRARGVSITVHNVVDLKSSGILRLHVGSLHIVRMRKPSDPAGQEWSCLPMMPGDSEEGLMKIEGEHEFAAMSHQALVDHVGWLTAENASLEGQRAELVKLQSTLQDEVEKFEAVNKRLIDRIEEARCKSKRERDVLEGLLKDAAAAEDRCKQERVLLDDRFDRMKADAKAKAVAAKAEAEGVRREAQSARDKLLSEAAALKAEAEKARAACAEAGDACRKAVAIAS